MTTYSALLRQALAGPPDRTAFVHGDRRLSYGEASAVVYGTARAMVDRGLAPGDGVAVLSANDPVAWCAAAGGIVAGGRWTPVNPMAATDDVVRIVQDADVHLVVHAPSHDEAAAQLGEAGLAVVPLDRLLAEAAVLPTTPLVVERDPEDIALLPYTGGTTGRPKGVALPHRSGAAMVLTMLAGTELGFEPQLLLSTPLTHAAGTLVVPALLRGGTVHVLDRFAPDAFVDAVARHRITAALAVPTMLYALLDHLGPGDAERLASLETLLYTAAPASPARLAEALDRLGPVLAQIYGQSEAPQTITYLSRADHIRDAALLASCGRPMPGIDVALLDDDGAPVPQGEPGEICVRGPLVMAGYWRQPEATAAALRDGWLRTGDVARADEQGYLSIVDRRKDMVITGGMNVFPREVEDVLCSHPAVAAAAVIGVPHDRWGEAVHAVVVPRPGAAVAPADLIALVRDRKGPVAAPKQVELVDALPLTGVGKVDKGALRAAHWAGRARQVS